LGSFPSLLFMVPAGLEVVDLVASIELFCAMPAREGGPELAADIAEVQRGRDMLDLKQSEMAAACAATDEYDEQGSVSPIHWMRHKLHMGGGAAADSVAVGEHLQSLPESHQSLVDGEIGFTHVALIARTAAAIAESGTNKPFDEAPLL